jgi:hypothetical protein
LLNVKIRVCILHLFRSSAKKCIICPPARVSATFPWSTGLNTNSIERPDMTRLLPPPIPLVFNICRHAIPTPVHRTGIRIIFMQHNIVFVAGSTAATLVSRRTGNANIISLKIIIKSCIRKRRVHIRKVFSYNAI